ncbi:MAG: ATP-binding cassette domain-containing protein [Ruminococcus sp.]|nr:ATP-binding cassette domain-containing protein [Ruminococcus sp.]
MTNYIIKTTSLSKHYGRFAANDNISVGIKKGSIYGLVGRNGAGKTTFMKMICSLSSPTSGSFELCGQSYPQLGSARSKIGNLIEDPGIYANMSAFDNLKAKGKLYGGVEKEKINEIIRIVGLEKAGSKPAGKFSLGMKQRLGIGLALVGDPEVLVLDEPINGLDPAGVAEIRETLQRLNSERGITIIISSHILGELSKLCTDYGFIDRGMLIKQITSDQLESDCTEYIRLLVNDTEKAKKVLRSLDIAGVTDGDAGEIRIVGTKVGTDEITEALVLNKIKVYEIAKQGTDLEGYYLSMIGNGRES